MKFLKRNFLWVIYFGFALIAMSTKKDDSILMSKGVYGFGKLVSWFLLLGFLIFSLYASRKENFFKSVKRINQYLWGRQIGLDLYIGLLLPLIIIYLHGGISVFLLWLIPVLLFANLATLLYLALNYDSLIAHFIL